MLKIIIRYGIIAGIILNVVLFFTGFLAYILTADNLHSELLGYSTMLVALSTVYFGIREYRDTHLGGTITFGKAFSIGIMISLIACTFYVLGWLVFFQFIDPKFVERYVASEIANLAASGITAEILEEKIQEMKYYQELYKNIFFRIGITFMEIFPVALVVTLISSALLRTKQEVAAS